MLFLFILMLSVCFLAYANGANDNFKGVATLFGSDTSNYKTSILWATVTTFAGSVVSIFLARGLIKRFLGKGLVPDSLAGTPEFLLAVAVGAGLTVMIATLAGFPISTTHSLIGALVGSGVAAVGGQVNFTVLGGAFFLPLLLSPILAVSFAALLYPVFRFCRVKLRVEKETCLCIGETELVVANPAGTLTVNTQALPEIAIGDEARCQQVYTGSVLGINAQKALDFAHFVSAGSVSFARGLNDTPKMVALLLAVQALQIEYGILAIAVAIALGGLLNARKVAETVSKKITPLNHGQGFTANLVTSFLVIVASRLGMPVSTTHVSVGSLFGIGLVTRCGNKHVMSEILLSWVLTLPMAAILSATVHWLMK